MRGMSILSVLFVLAVGVALASDLDANPTGEGGDPVPPPEAPATTESQTSLSTGEDVTVTADDDSKKDEAAKPVAVGAEKPFYCSHSTSEKSIKYYKEILEQQFKQTVDFSGCVERGWFWKSQSAIFKVSYDPKTVKKSWWPTRFGHIIAKHDKNEEYFDCGKDEPKGADKTKCIGEVCTHIVKQVDEAGKYREQLAETLATEVELVGCAKQSWLPFSKTNAFYKLVKEIDEHKVTEVQKVKGSVVAADHKTQFLCTSEKMPKGVEHKWCPQEKKAAGTEKPKDGNTAPADPGTGVEVKVEISDEPENKEKEKIEIEVTDDKPDN